MSINSALLAGVAGLKANSSALAVISDNIANVNTTSYKRAEADFQTLVTGSAPRGTYAAGGVTTSTRRYITQDGQLEQSVSATDLGIDGPGFFIVTEKPEGVLPADPRSFTRLGNFTQDDLGYLRNSAGGYLQGWPVDQDGNVARDPSDLSRLDSVNVTDLGGTADATTRITLSAKLDAGTTVTTAATNYMGGGANDYDPSVVGQAMAGYDPTVPNSGVKPDFQLQMPVLDSQGGKHVFEMAFLRSSVPNQWFVEIYAVPANQVQTGAGLINGQIKVGRIQFTPDGRYDAAATAALTQINPPAANAGPPGLFTSVNSPILDFLPSNHAAALAAGEVKWNTAYGVAAQSVRLELDQAAGGIIQAHGRSETIGLDSNGTPFGALDTIEIDEEGFVTAAFKNGVRRQIAQVAIATFQNPDALVPISGSAYQVSLDSGTYNLKASGDGGAGTISPATLETSNVDLSTEFTNLITTQRAYSASSKIITTADEMMEELLRVKR
jgi:flagellar hook protein FlgE